MKTFKYENNDDNKAFLQKVQPNETSWSSNTRITYTTFTKSLFLMVKLKVL